MKRSLKLIMTALTALIVPALGWAEEATWTPIKLPAAQNSPASKDDFATKMGEGATGGSGSASFALGVLDKYLSAAPGSITVGFNGNKNSDDYGLNSDAVGEECYWSGNSVSLWGRSGVGGESAVVVVPTDSITAGTNIKQLRITAAVKSMTCALDNADVTSRATTTGQCSIGIGLARYADSAYSYVASASAASSGTNSFTATINFDEAVTWTTETNPYKIILALTAPAATWNNIYVIGDVTVEYLTAEAYAAVVSMRTVPGTDANWSTESEWTGGLPTEGKNVEITASGDATLTMDVDSATLGDLRIIGEGSLTFDGDKKLTATATVINTDTDVSAITASLGAVTIAKGKTLTLGPVASTTVGSVAGEGNLVLGAGVWNVPLSATEITLGSGTEWVASGSLAPTTIIINSGDSFASIYNTGVTNSVNPFTWNDTTKICGSGNLLLGGTSGGGGHYLPFNLTASAESTFSGNIYTVNRYARFCKTTVSGTAFDEAVYNFPTSYENQVKNCVNGATEKANELLLAGDTTLAGVNSADANEKIITSVSGTSRTLTLNVAEGKSHSVKGTFGDSETALSLVKSGAGDQTIGTAHLANLTVTGGTLTLTAVETVTGTITLNGGTLVLPNDSYIVTTTVEGKKVNNDNGTYTLVDDVVSADPVCTDSAGNAYTSVQAAINAWVKMYEDGTTDYKSISLQATGVIDETALLPEGWSLTFLSVSEEASIEKLVVQDEDGNTITAVNGAYSNISGVASVTIGEAVTEYTTLADAIDAAVAAEKATLTFLSKDALTLETTWVIENEIILNLGNTSLEATFDYAAETPAALWVKNGGKLTLQAGTLSSKAEGIRIGVKGATDAATQAGTVVIEAGTNVESSDDIGVLIYGGSSLTSAGSITSQATAAIQGNGLETLDTTIAITAGSVYSANDVAIYHPQPGTLTIGKEGGAVWAPAISGATGVEMRAGTLNMLSGIITTTAGEFSYAANGNGSTVVGAAIAVSQHTTGKDIAVDITAGATNGVCSFALVNTTGNPSVNITADLASSVDPDTVQILNPNYTLKATTTGEEPNTVTTYSIEKAAAKIGTTGYPTLAAALEAVTTSKIKTITLLTKGDDGVTAITIPTGVTLDIATPTMGASGQSATNVSFADGVTVTAEQGATVKLTSGGGYFNIAGAGTVEAVGGDAFVYGMGSVKNTISANLVIPADKVLNVRAWDKCASLGGGNITVNGEIKENGGNAGALKVAVAADKALSGTGTIGSALTLAYGAVIDIDGVNALTVNGTVTVDANDEEETLLGLTLNDGAFAAETDYTDVPVLICTNAADIAELIPAPEGYDTAVDGTTIKLVKIITVPEEITIGGDESTKQTLSAEAIAVLQAIAEAAGESITSVNVPTAAHAEAVDAALQVFTGIVDVDTATGAATVGWQFGISEIVRNPKNMNQVIITAKVTQVDGETAAGYAANATVKLDGITATAVAGETTGEVTFTVNIADLVGKQLKVKASIDSSSGEGDGGSSSGSN